jgi:hypothetical protein
MQSASLLGSFSFLHASVPGDGARDGTYFCAMGRAGGSIAIATSGTSSEIAVADADVDEAGATNESSGTADDPGESTRATSVCVGRDPHATIAPTRSHALRTH